MVISPSDILKKVVSETITVSPKAKPKKEKVSPLITKLGEIINHKPWNQCPVCKVVGAYQLMLPPSIHEIQTDGSVKLVRDGEATYECRYCHLEKLVDDLGG